MTMVERVARALAKQEGYAYDPLPYDARARAAIEAMREPSDEMVAAGAMAEGDGNLDAEALNLWSAMINAALADEKADAQNRT